MGLEIERKYLVISDEYKSATKGVLYRQGYLNSNKERVVRVRIGGEQGFITIKGLPTGIERPEFEYSIPLQEADFLLRNICEQPIIEKTRYKITYMNHLWEIDEFHGENKGMIVAEIELQSSDEPFEMPPWVGEEVSHDWRYFNSNLLTNPYTKWNH